MQCRYTCLDCEWPTDPTEGCWETALNHFVATGHEIEMRGSSASVVRLLPLFLAWVG